MIGKMDTIFYIKKFRLTSDISISIATFSPVPPSTFSPEISREC